MQMEPPPKQLRTSTSVDSDEQQHNAVVRVATSLCHLTRMPLELILEILSYLPYPRDILALTRTSKHFCAVLVNNKATEFIWRRSRIRQSPSLRVPDPTPNFTEASFAAFLFDSKTCEVCQNRTKEPFYSFALRGALCGKIQCLTTWRTQILRRVTAKDQIEYPEFLHWMPRLERTDGSRASQVFVRQSDWQQAIEEHTSVHLLGEEAIEAYVAEKQALVDVLPAKLELFKKLLQWRERFEAARKQINAVNLERATSFANTNGWGIKEMLQTSTGANFYNSKNRCLEAIEPNEFEKMGNILATEILANKAREVWREQAQVFQERLNEVKASYKALKSQDECGPAIPPLNDFRKLSVIKIFETTKQAEESARHLRDPFVASILADNLQQWRQSARAALAAVLGFPSWKTLGKRKLHPVDRLTARFRCQSCDKAWIEKKKPITDGGMDFKQASEHQCACLHRKKKGKYTWSADRFVRDDQAIEAISQVLALCGTSPDHVDSLDVIDDIGDRIKCQSCSCVMDVSSVGRHCKRHAECSFTLLPSEFTLKRPIEHGLTKELISPKLAKDRDLKIYVCRHCTSNASSDGVNGRAGSNKLLTFNGLRSHVKEKHLIISLEDEDFFRQKDTDAPATTSGSANDDA